MTTKRKITSLLLGTAITISLYAGGMYAVTANAEGSLTQDNSSVVSLTANDQTTYYSTFEELLDYIHTTRLSSSTITLLADYTMTDTSYTSFNPKGEVVLDTAQYTLNTYGFTLQDTKLTITGNGTLNCMDAECSMFEVSYGGDLVLNSGTLSGENVKTIDIDDPTSGPAKATINGGTLNAVSITENPQNTYLATLVVNGGTLSGDFFVYGNGTPSITLNGGTYTAQGSEGYARVFTPFLFFEDILGEGKSYYKANGEPLVLAGNTRIITEPFYVAGAPASVENKDYALGYVAGESIPAPTVNNFIVTSDEGAEVSFAWKQGETLLDTIPTQIGTYTLEVTVEAGENYSRGVTRFTVEIFSPVASLLMNGETTYYGSFVNTLAVLNTTKPATATITLLADDTTEDTLFFNFGGHLTIDTNEYTLTATQFYLESNTKLTLAGNGGLYASIPFSEVFNISGGCALVMESGSILGANATSIYAEDTGVGDVNVTINGGTVQNIHISDVADNGYAVTLVVNDGTLSGDFYLDGAPNVILNGGNYTAKTSPNAPNFMSISEVIYTRMKTFSARQKHIIKPTANF